TGRRASIGRGAVACPGPLWSDCCLGWYPWRSEEKGLGGLLQIGKDSPSPGTVVADPHFFRRAVMVMNVTHLPSSPSRDDVSTRVSLSLISITSFILTNLLVAGSGASVCRVRTWPFAVPSYVPRPSHIEHAEVPN